MAHEHDYRLQLRWEGDPATGTASYAAYDRQFRVTCPGKPDLVGSANPAFRGDPAVHDPEDLFLAAIASCHMLAYLALCARAGIRVVGYVDDARGRLVMRPGGGGRFEHVVLHPRVEIAAGGDVARAIALHAEAHARCFIASSCSVPITCDPTVTVTSGAATSRVAPRQDLAVRLRDQPGALAELGEALGRAGISLEGGGGFAVGDGCIVHFLVRDGERAASALRAAGIEVLDVRETIAVRLAQGEPGQLGKLARAMADAGVNIASVYSDHDHQLIVCVDDAEVGARVAATWRQRGSQRRNDSSNDRSNDRGNERRRAEACAEIAVASSADDIAYVRANFVTLEELARGRAIPVAELHAWAGVQLPGASYALPDGETYYARDWWRLHDEAGGVAGVRPLFERRYRAATATVGVGDGELAAEWDAYLAGLYGVCLRAVTPENIVAKAQLVSRLELALAAPRSEDPVWCGALRADVEALDGLSRRFAACDRERFGRPTSRERLIDTARRRFPHVFAE